MFERLEEIKQVCKDRKEFAALVKQAIEIKEKSIESKEKLLELMDMLIINRVNMVEEIQFIEKRKEIQKLHSYIESSASISAGFRLECDSALYSSMGVSELVKFFEDSARIHSSKGLEKMQIEKPSKTQNESK
ncbi:hypothetical protein NEMIN01_1348 [Nematocida minor]|uniref:uncharacterized protein n=1 Tax=Nematocida minor TaxID=1912983 RepID=UPI00221F3933|nr:uncharacterized protein NEMIN01_1348 [Nematocida minor]KAI5191079.1 hypothetical protein NEMIN01_1348 [Nematocida minor]